MAKIKIIPTNEIVEVDTHRSVFEQLKEKDIHINSSCGGCASCTKCIIKLTSGEENMNEIPFEEKQILGNVFHLTKERLSCQLIVSGDVEVDISEHIQEGSKSKKKVIRRTQSEKLKLKDEKEKERKENPKKPKEGGFKRPRAFKYDATENDEE